MPIDKNKLLDFVRNIGAAMVSGVLALETINDYNVHDNTLFAVSGIFTLNGNGIPVNGILILPKAIASDLHIPATTPRYNPTVQ